MKILHLIYNLSSGGAERFVVDLANRQLVMGHKVIVCMIRPVNELSGFNRQFLNPGVKYVSLGIESRISWAKIQAVKEFVLSQGVDVLHCHHNVIPYLVSLLFCNRRPYIVHTIHSAAERANANTLERFFCRWLYKQKRVVPVTISHASYESFVSVYGIDADCIFNGRESQTPSPMYDEVQTFIKGLKKDNSTRVFVHVGRCHPIKNQQVLIDAFNELDNEGIDYVLLIIGAAFDSELGGSLKAAAGKRIYFLGEKNNVSDYLLNADAFCLTSKSEGLSISLLEAMDCGATPICTPVGGTPDVVVDGQSGYLSKDLTVNAYIQALRRYLDKPLDRQYLHDFFVGNYSMEKCCLNYLSLYESLTRNN